MVHFNRSNTALEFHLVRGRDEIKDVKGYLQFPCTNCGVSTDWPVRRTACTVRVVPARIMQLFHWGVLLTAIKTDPFTYQIESYFWHLNLFCNFI